MGYNDHMDFDILNRIEELLEMGMFEKGSVEYGIARAYAHGQLLSKKQQYIFEHKIVPILNIPLNDEEEFRLALQKDWEAECFIARDI